MTNYRSVFNKKQELVKILEARGMIVEDKTIFSRVSYSHLIYNFGKHYLINPNEKKYKPGTRLSHVYNFYRFNMIISFKLMKGLSYLEHELRANISSYLSLSGPLEYLKKETYSPSNLQNSFVNQDINRSYREIDKLLSTLIAIEQNCRAKYDEKHHIDGKLPIWLLVDELPFGQLRMLIKYTTIKDDVLKAMNIDQKKWWIIVVANQYRNQISHIHPLIPSITHESGREYHLKDLLLLIKEKYEKVFIDIVISYNQFNFNLINLSREYVTKYLDIAEVIESYFPDTIKFISKK